jgi:hypothetical protein
MLSPPHRPALLLREPGCRKRSQSVGFASNRAPIQVERLSCCDCSNQARCVRGMSDYAPQWRAAWPSECANRRPSRGLRQSKSLPAVRMVRRVFTHRSGPVPSGTLAMRLWRAWRKHKLNRSAAGTVNSPEGTSVKMVTALWNRSRLSRSGRRAGEGPLRPL